MILQIDIEFITIRLQNLLEHIIVIEMRCFWFIFIEYLTSYFVPRSRCIDQAKSCEIALKWRIGVEWCKKMLPLTSKSWEFISSYVLDMTRRCMRSDLIICAWGKK